MLGEHLAMSGVPQWGGKHGHHWGYISEIRQSIYTAQNSTHSKKLLHLNQSYLCREWESPHDMPVESCVSFLKPAMRILPMFFPSTTIRVCHSEMESEIKAQRKKMTVQGLPHSLDRERNATPARPPAPS